MDATPASVPITQAPPPATRKLRTLRSLLPYVRPYGRQVQGRHAELIARGTLYARLAALQFAA